MISFIFVHTIKYEKDQKKVRDITNMLKRDQKHAKFKESITALCNIKKIKKNREHRYTF